MCVLDALSYVLLEVPDRSLIRYNFTWLHGVLFFQIIDKFLTEIKMPKESYYYRGNSGWLQQVFLAKKLFALYVMQIWGVTCQSDLFGTWGLLYPVPSSPFFSFILQSYTTIHNSVFSYSWKYFDRHLILKVIIRLLFVSVSQLFLFSSFHLLIRFTDSLPKQDAGGHGYTTNSNIWTFSFTYSCCFPENPQQTVFILVQKSWVDRSNISTRTD